MTFKTDTANNRNRNRNERCSSPPNTYSSDVSEADDCDSDSDSMGEAEAVSSEEVISAILSVNADDDVTSDDGEKAINRESGNTTPTGIDRSADDQDGGSSDNGHIVMDAKNAEMGNGFYSPMVSSPNSSRTDGFPQSNVQEHSSVYASPHASAVATSSEPVVESAATQIEDSTNHTPCSNTTAWSLAEALDAAADTQLQNGVGIDPIECSKPTVEREVLTSDPLALGNPPLILHRRRALSASDSPQRDSALADDAVSLEQMIPDQPIVTTPPPSPETTTALDPLRRNRKSLPAATPSRTTAVSIPGRRSIHLRLFEEVIRPAPPVTKSTGILDTPFRKAFSIVRSKRTRSQSSEDASQYSNKSKNLRATPEPSKAVSESSSDSTLVDRGIVTVSWYEGTTSPEMQEHVKNCVLRKLNINMSSKLRLEEMRLLDEGVEPPEEVVLCPYLPDGAHFLLKFKTKVSKPKVLSTPHRYRHPYASRAPDSPSAAASPFPSSSDLPSVSSMHAQQMHVLNAAAAILQPNNGGRHSILDWNAATRASAPLVPSMDESSVHSAKNGSMHERNGMQSNGGSAPSLLKSGEPEPPLGNHTDRLIEQQLRQLNELLLLRRDENPSGAINGGAVPVELSESDPYKAYRREERKQVIFVIANYLVLFMSLIAVSAEMQSRLPLWMDWVQANVDSVQNCATDRDALFECVSSGNFSGLVASFLLWATQSVAAKRIFLFGFDSPKRLWTVVYEAGVTAVCWGTSYIFIRRALNPDTRPAFLQKYYKDAVYGSLAGFNAAFMKAVLKNLISEDVALEALESRQLKIVGWLGALLSSE